MGSIDIGETAFLKPNYIPVMIVGRVGDLVRIQHATDPELLFTRGEAKIYCEKRVEIIGDTFLSRNIPSSTRGSPFFDGRKKYSAY